MYSPISLNYSINDLEPYIDGETMALHYGVLYMNYLNNLNNILSKYDYDIEKDLIISNLNLFNREDIIDIIYNLGGVLNHELYFQNISPNRVNKPFGSIGDAINSKYGSFEKFKEEFIRKGMEIKGSGYVFLVMAPNGELDIITLPNQENPYLYGFVPLMAMDVWEHAYYLNQKTDKKKYFNDFFEVINFVYINNLYEDKKM